jgi:hypothetical protein
MKEQFQDQAGGAALSEADPAVEHLERSLLEGKQWYVALLEAIGLWKKAGETHNGRDYRYLIAGEAFDWLLLAERLCDSVPGLIPENEKNALLFRGRPPVNLSPDKFKELIGAAKYHHYLNYFYGITAEEALVLAVEEEVRKEKTAWGYSREIDATNEAYRRIYGPTLSIMLRHFRREKGYPELKSIDLTELKEFAYWRFKFRLKLCEKAKVARDSRKAINWLKVHGVTSYIQRTDIPEVPDEPPSEPA